MEKEIAYKIIGCPHDSDETIIRKIFSNKREKVLIQIEKLKNHPELQTEKKRLENQQKELYEAWNSIFPFIPPPPPPPPPAPRKPWWVILFKLIKKCFILFNRFTNKIRDIFLRVLGKIPGIIYFLVLIIGIISFILKYHNHTQSEFIDEAAPANSTTTISDDEPPPLVNQLSNDTIFVTYKNPVRVGEKFQVTFTFRGEWINSDLNTEELALIGKEFKRPFFPSVFYIITDNPVWDNQKIIGNENTIETQSFTYSLTAEKSGTFKMGSASIVSKGKKIESEPFFITVHE